MSPHVVLAALAGPLAGREFTFDSPAIISIGRSEDSQIRIPSECGDLTASRHHCLLDIDDDCVRVHDLGSRNGTFVNGQIIGQRGRDAMPGVELRDGDHLAIGASDFLVSVVGGDESDSPAWQNEVDVASFTCC